MSHMSSGWRYISVIIFALALAACTRSLAPSPLPTPTVVSPESLFAEAMPTTMEDIGALATQTALSALTLTPASPPPTPTPLIEPTETPQGEQTETPEAESTTSPEPFITPTTPIPTQETPTAGIVTPTLIAGIPTTYTLQQGEWPYCIARRFNVNPDELLQLNNLTREQSKALLPGLTLKIPQTGNPFPGDRSWHDHPDTFTVGVTSDAETIYGVACYYGDIDPMEIARANNLTPPYTLPAGKVLQIP
ncbi:MAG: LysM peptidoglycan-binding domain-containing protein [Anaerolineae bacterium]|nr:MAG: LysM peptidoglycan-binding domain-containing protein [Anaerolineae bacterium]